MPKTLAFIFLIVLIIAAGVYVARQDDVPTSSNDQGDDDALIKSISTELQLADDAVNADWTPVIREFDGYEMVLVPAGCFLMGAESGQGNETPVHEQCIDQPFWLDRYEVTNEQYGSYNYWPDPDFPYAGISWIDATVFCAQRGARLPSEVEWEFAARGVDNLRYPWGNELVDENVTHSENSIDPVVVTSHPAGVSWVGAFNLSGNIAEWTSSIYLPYPFSPEAQAETALHEEEDHDEPGHDHSILYTVRGGSFSESNLFYLAGWARYGLPAEEDLPNLGFRCVRTYTD